MAFQHQQNYERINMLIEKLPFQHKAVIYARYSTDLQRATSIDDQIRVCTDRAKRESWGIVGSYSDPGVSGSIPLERRPGSNRLLRDARSKKFTILILESLDRLSRDSIEQELTIRRLEFAGIRVIGVSDGYDSLSASPKLSRTVRGLINEIFLDDLREKTHRGLSGQVSRGGHAGGSSYGYRSIPVGSVKKLEVIEEQAVWVRWIFQKFGHENWSTQKIASELNRLGVKTARGKTWGVSAIFGCPTKGSGVLNNKLYIGTYVWNRSTWLKNPDTQQRERFDRPEDEWSVEARPELRIVSDELWQAVWTRMNTDKLHNGSKGPGPRPKSLLGGLMTCCKCGGAIIAVSGRYYGCATRKDRGPYVCEGVSFSRQNTDKSIISILQAELLTETATTEFSKLVVEMLQEERKEIDLERAKMDSDITRIEKEIERIVDAISYTGISTALHDRLRSRESELADLKIKASTIQSSSLKDKAINEIVANYEKLVSDLKSTLEENTAGARPVVQSLFGKILVEEKSDGVFADIETRRDRLLLAANGLSPMVVAGAGLEPATFGL